MQLLDQWPEKFLHVIWNPVTKKYLKFVTLSSFFKISIFLFKNWKKMEKTYMDSEKLINKFFWK